MSVPSPSCRIAVAMGFCCLVAESAGLHGAEQSASKAPSAAVLATANTFELHGQTFTLPTGFIVESAAAAPVVSRPITIDFDEQGRLYATECFGAIEKADVAQQKKIHRVVRLEDTDGDGRFDKRVVFADQIPFPEGTMWLNGSLYVAAPPSIWKLTDANGDGVAEQRVEWFKGNTLTGCANDLHGPYRGPDGWIYWAKGAFAKQTYDRPGRQPLVTRASHIFRARPDGSGIESVMTGGMDNPVDVVFTSTGERILSNTFIQNPGGGKRDGLLHAVYGGVYGKEHDVVYEHPWTGPDLMPIMTHHGPSASCGLVCAESGAWGREYDGNLYACLFNLHRVTRHVLVPRGATFTTKDEDFLVSSSADFHPTDIIEDADGSLLVADTGGWYKLCCPTSQLVKAEVLGGIYRIRKKDAKTPEPPKADDPRGLKIDWKAQTVSQLVQSLDDPRHAVRQRAADGLVTPVGAADVANGFEQTVTAMEQAIKNKNQPAFTRHALWALIRMDSDDARQLVRRQLESADESVRQVALQGVSLWRDREAIDSLMRLLKGESRGNRRLAAECMGRIGDARAVPALLAALPSADDRFQQHAIIHALIEIGDSKALTTALSDENTSIQRGAMIALDQMPLAGHIAKPGVERSRLDAAPVVKALVTNDAALREAAGWIVARHPEWGGHLATELGKRLMAADQLPAQQQDELARQLGRLAGAPEIQALLIKPSTADPSTSPAAEVAMRAMSQSRVKQVPQAWIAWLTAALATDSTAIQAQAVATIRALPWGKDRPAPLVAALLRIADSDKADADRRLAALTAIPVGAMELSAERMAFLLGQLDRDQPVTRRSLAAETITRAKLSADQLALLTDKLDRVAATEINQMLDAFAQSTDAALGLKLAAALKKAPAFAALRPDHLQTRLSKFGPDVQREAAALAAMLNIDLAEQRKHLEKTLAELKNGDIKRGHVVFRSAKAACSTCHATGYVGGTVGPDLTRVGAIRAERDLLESIIFPSLSFVQGYEPWTVTTKDGDVHVGRLTKNATDEVVLVCANREVRLPREQIAEIQPGKVSIMPSGLEQQLSKQELADLVAFLKSCK